MLRMRLVFIYGPPGVGKLTVANELARLTSYKVFHNHLSINCVRPVFDFGTPSMPKLVTQIRLAVLEEAAREDIDIIFTFVYAHPEDAAFVEKTCNLIERFNGSVSPVRLTCDMKVLEQRVGSVERKSLGKLTTVEPVYQLMERHDLLSPAPGQKSLTIDNTMLAPAEVAQRVVDYFRLTASHSEL